MGISLAFRFRETVNAVVSQRQSARTAMRGSKTVAILSFVAVALRTARAFRGEDDHDAKWVRMCTMTDKQNHRDGAQFNATMPCGVHVRPDPEPGSGGGALSLHETAPVDDSGKRGISTAADAVNGNRRQSSEDDEDTGMVRLETLQVDVAGRMTESVSHRGDGDGGDDAEDDADGDVTGPEIESVPGGDGTAATDEDDATVMVTDEDDGGDQNDVAVETDEDDGGDQNDVAVETDEDDGGDRKDVAVETDEDDSDRQDVAVQTTDKDDGTVVTEDHRQEYEDGGGSDDVTVIMEGDGGGEHEGLEYLRKQGKVARVLLTYLMSARNKLYSKIRYILNLLQNTFYKAKLERRRRRSSVERQMILNANKNQGNNIEKQSISPLMITDPLFERSLMTMSFLMFGVFVIQVVQKLMRIIQRSDEVSSMDSFMSRNLPMASSSIFNHG
ncbi:Hypothetical protein CINCED_3A022412 [Cinara cedri]|uniref:Uncharacterized protein n=1 Tax=Cinara cedri TaxID=506608 RepID=A0A5E4M1N6_9HEMI|nr:Hypothetical protein CINCED_3A022412 [Cinara cedri]